MFTGIVQTTGTVIQFEKQKGTCRLGLECSADFLNDITTGASVAVDGACLTVVKFTNQQVYFDLIQATLDATSFSQLQLGDTVNLERAARFGDEIGGHLLSGHIHTTAKLQDISKKQDQYVVALSIAPQWMDYIFAKGYIAVAGTSLTIQQVDRRTNSFEVHLIPETLRITNLEQKKLGCMINIEIDQQTQTIVDTTQLILSDTFHKSRKELVSDQKL